MEILTPFQQKLLKTIGDSSLADNFYLTGGTALSAFYLQHRYSEDPITQLRGVPCLRKFTGLAPMIVLIPVV
jgi:hypothetical protein